MALVPHHAAYLDAGGAGTVRQARRVVGVTATAGQPDVDVDQDRADTAGDRGVERGVGVDGDGDPRGVGERAEPGEVERLVGEEEVVAEARRHHPLDLA